MNLRSRARNERNVFYFCKFFFVVVVFVLFCERSKCGAHAIICSVLGFSLLFSVFAFRKKKKTQLFSGGFGFSYGIIVKVVLDFFVHSFFL